MPAGELLADLIDQIEDVCVIGGGQREKRKLLGPGGIDGRLRRLNNFIHGCVRAPGA